MEPQPNTIDDLFERNADMRLLDLKRERLGVKTVEGSTRSGSSFSAESIMPTDEPAAVPDTASLRVAIAAVPSEGVIPGAVVGVAIDITNDGHAPAPESTLMLPLPHEGTMRAGSLKIDGRDALGPERLFADGLPLPRIAGDATLKVTFQLQILPGLSSLLLQPRLQSEGVPIVGTMGMAIKRGSIRPLETAAATPPRPFYELEEDEIDEIPIDDLAIIPEPVFAEPEPADQPAQAEPVAEEPAFVEPDAPARPATVAALRRVITPNESALLAKLFLGDQPGTIAHFLLIAAIACGSRDTAQGGGVLAFAAGDIEALGRSVVLARMGKAMTYRVAQSDLESIDYGTESTGRPAAVPGGGIVLFADPVPGSAEAVDALVHSADRDPTLRSRLILLAFAANRISVDDASQADGAEAFSRYRAAAIDWLVPPCIASAGQPVPIPVPNAAVDAAGRAVAAMLTQSRQ